MLEDQNFRIASAYITSKVAREDETVSTNARLSATKERYVLPRWSWVVLMRLGEITIAAYFLPFMPAWMPAAWLALMFASSFLHMWACSGRQFSQKSATQRMWTDRIFFWLQMACAGSGVFFLNVPGNANMQGVLNVCMVAIAAMSVLQRRSDAWRGVVSAALVMIPLSVWHFSRGNTDNTLLGVGGCMITLALAMMAHKQHAQLLEQVQLRKRAEDATEAVASIGLSKLRFFAAVSHDLRQPVHAIGLYLAPLLESEKAGRTKQAVDGIYQSWQALDDLLSQVLDLTRMDAGNLQAELVTIELAPLIRGLVVQHSAAAERKGIRVVAMVPTQRYVLADLLMLKRVLSNLLDNAIKFSPEDARIAVALRSRGSDWCVQVRDAGPGISQASQAKVFEEFVQLDNPERDRSLGMGLGLSIAQRFVALMNGQLTLRSAPGAGTCMSVVLPKTSPQPNDFSHSGKYVASKLQNLAPQVPLKVPASVLSLLQRTGKALLLVEDDLLVAQAIIQLMKDLDVPVLHATSATNATALAYRACLAACDVRLPGTTSGMELAVGLTHLRIGALLMTGETSVEVRAAALRNGLILLVKPVKPQALLDGLGQLADRLA
jgi:two-component system, sensor histidine kinase